MISRILWLLPLWLFLSTAQADHPKAEIEAWLEKMHKASHMLTYEGVFVYDQNDQMSSMKIIHSVDENGEYGHLISLDGSGREVIRSGDTVTCILPDKKAVVVDKRRPDQEFPPSFPLKIDQLLKSYSFHFGGDGVVAGQRARKMVIKPRDKYRYGHDLWIDHKTGLLLKDYLIGNDGKIVEQFMFTQIVYPQKIERERLRASTPTGDYKKFQVKEDQAPPHKTHKNMNWRVTRVPAGFEPGMQRHHKMAMSKMPVEHFLFSDGLSSVSVYIEKKMNHKNLIGGSTMGAVNAYGREVGDFHITVVGEVPQVTVKMMGDSVERIKK